MMKNRGLQITARAAALAAALAIMDVPALASDACSARRIHTEARVSASDGTKFTMKSYFQTKDSAALRRIEEEEKVTIALEGPFVWSGNRRKQALGGNDLKSFVLGHQFHALLLRFGEIMEDAQPSDEIPYEDGTRSGFTGKWPHGGEAHLILDRPQGGPEALKLALTGMPEILVTFHKWRKVGNRTLPFEIRIFDESRTFIYSYTNIEIANGSPLWFHQRIEAPSLDAVKIYRLHRRILAAHCLGDAKMIAALSARDHINIGQGDVTRSSPADLRAMFADIFGRLTYAEYHDRMTPIIEVSQSGDLGWVTATVQPVGKVAESGNAFNDRWSWLMAVKKVDGNWKVAAISASRAD